MKLKQKKGKISKQLFREANPLTALHRRELEVVASPRNEVPIDHLNQLDIRSRALLKEDPALLPSTANHLRGVIVSILRRR